MPPWLRQYLPPPPYSRAGLGIALLPAFVAAVLLAVEYHGLPAHFFRRYGAALAGRGYDANEISFFAQAYYSAFTFVAFIVLPLAYHRLLPPARPGALGLSLDRCRPHLPAYGALLAVMLPVLWVMAAQPSFHHFYPLYKPSSLERLALYEAIYLTQFVGVEFFFRGFALFRLEQHIGRHAVTVMVIPYALLHIHKPFAEALAAIVAGLVLGTLALKGRSIWPGVAVHAGVALSMDLFALIRSGRWAGLA